jgi:hypothetical protein
MEAIEEVNESAMVKQLILRNAIYVVVVVVVRTPSFTFVEYLDD